MKQVVMVWLSEEKLVSRKVMLDFLEPQLASWRVLGKPIGLMGNVFLDYCLRGGKWHRPALTRLIIEALGGSVKPEQTKASVALELLHRYILAHDDILDQDDWRHGGLTIQAWYRKWLKKQYPKLPDRTYALGQAMVGGDVLNALAYQLVVESGLKPKIANQVVRLLNQLFVETAAGWMLETELKNRKIVQVSEKQIYQAMELVSARYSLVWPIRLGQLLAGVEYSNWDQSLDEYGRQLGLAFQLRDDILAIFGNKRETGKPVGNDLREKKKSWLLWETYNRASLNEKEKLERGLGHDLGHKQFEEIKEIIVRTNAKLAVERKVLFHAKKALKELDKAALVSLEAKNKLIELAEYLAFRKT